MGREIQSAERKGLSTKNSIPNETTFQNKVKKVLFQTYKARRMYHQQTQTPGNIKESLSNKRNILPNGNLDP